MIVVSQYINGYYFAAVPPLPVLSMVETSETVIYANENIDFICICKADIEPESHASMWIMKNGVNQSRSDYSSSNNEITTSVNLELVATDDGATLICLCSWNGSVYESE